MQRCCIPSAYQSQVLHRSCSCYLKHVFRLDEVCYQHIVPADSFLSSYIFRKLLCRIVTSPNGHKFSIYLDTRVVLLAILFVFKFTAAA